MKIRYPFLLTGIIHISILTFLVILTFIPLKTRIQKSDNSRTDVLLHGGFEPDYSVYLATITMGQTGHFYYRNYYSPTETKPLPIHSWYWITGALTGPFHMWPPYAYHLARVLTVLLFGFAFYLLCRTLFSQAWQITLAILVVYLMPIMPKNFYHLEYLPLGQWWNSWLEPTRRIDPPPHHLFAEACLLFALTFYFHWKKKKSLVAFALCIVALCVVVVTLPHTLFPFLCILSFDILIQIITSIRKRNFKSSIRNLIGPFGLIVLCLVTLKMLSIVLSDPLWIQNQQWEIWYWGREVYFYYDLYMAYLPLLLISIPALLYGLRKGKNNRLLLAIWVITPILFSPFLTRLGIGSGRLIGTAIHIPLSLLTTLTISDFIKAKILKPIVVVIFMCVFTLFSIYAEVNNTQVRVRNIQTESISNWLYYLPRSVYDGAIWVKDNLPPDSIVMTPESLGNIVVSFAPVIVYEGDQTHGINWDLDETNVYFFYQRKMTEQDAYKLLLNKKIDYVIDLFTFGQKNPVSTYTFLTPLWKNSALEVYRVKKIK